MSDYDDSELLDVPRRCRCGWVTLVQACPGCGGQVTTRAPQAYPESAGPSGSACRALVAAVLDQALHDLKAYRRDKRWDALRELQRWWYGLDARGWLAALGINQPAACEALVGQGILPPREEVEAVA